MKSKEVLNFLNISRVTLTKYVKNGTIKVTKLDNGYYDYDNDSVFIFLKKIFIIIIFVHVFLIINKKNNLDNQINFLSIIIVETIILKLIKYFLKFQVILILIEKN